ncbi:hypothetical protein ABPG72_002016 [Tetrahymena utriculariae]
MSEESNNQLEEVKVEESKIPKEFLKDVWIQPKINIDPENEKHEEFVNKQIRNDLWIESFTKISDVEMNFLKGQEDFLKIKTIRSCDKDDSLFQKILTKQVYEVKEDEMLKCEEWTLNLNDKKEVKYRVKHFQSEADRFYSIIFPQDLLRYYYLFKSQYRIKFY